MNPEARKFFAEEPMLPASPYWYYSATIRVPNPAVKPWTFSPRLPWTNKEIHGHPSQVPVG